MFHGMQIPVSEARPQHTAAQPPKLSRGGETRRSSRVSAQRRGAQRSCALGRRNAQRCCSQSAGTRGVEAPAPRPGALQRRTANLETPATPGRAGVQIRHHARSDCRLSGAPANAGTLAGSERRNAAPRRQSGLTGVGARGVATYNSSRGGDRRGSHVQFFAGLGPEG